MKIQALKFHCNEEAHLSSLSFLTDLKVLYLKLNLYMPKDLDSIVRKIHLPCSLQHLYVLHRIYKKCSASKMEKIAKKIHETIKAPFGCKVVVIVYTGLTVTSCEMDGVFQYHDDRCLMKSNFLDKLSPYEDDDYFVVKGNLSFPQLLKIKELIELEESNSEPNDKSVSQDC